LTGQFFSYQEGLDRCNEIREQLKASNSKALAFVRPDCMEGARLPEFEATTIDGRTITDVELKGQVSVINFWFIYASSGGYTDERAVQEVIEKLPPVIKAALKE